MNCTAGKLILLSFCIVLLCEKIQTGNFKDSCYLKVYRKTGDSALCEEISDPGIKSLCTGEPVMVE